MRKFLISASTLLILTSCQKSVFVWTFDGLLTSIVIGAILLLMLIVWLYSKLSKLFNPKKKKICKITNDRFSWVLEVDNMTINFDNSHNAEYFERHYKSLGYTIIWDRDKWRREE